MAEPKTRPTGASVDAFVSGIDDPVKQADCRILIDKMTAATSAPPKMWGESIVGFGEYQMRYASGKTGAWMEVGFSPRKRNLVVYVMPGFGAYETLLAGLGPHRTGSSCLYLTRLARIDLEVLDALIRVSVAELRSRRT